MPELTFTTSEVSILLMYKCDCEFSLAAAKKSCKDHDIVYHKLVLAQNVFSKIRGVVIVKYSRESLSKGSKRRGVGV